MELTEMLKKEKIPYKKFHYAGTCIGESAGFPENVGNYKTQRHGYLDRFKCGQHEVVEKEEKWLRVWHIRDIGSAAEPGGMISIYVPEKHHKPAFELAKRRMIEKGKDYYHTDGGEVWYVFRWPD